MTDQKPKNESNTPQTPEEAANLRVKELQTALARLQSEIRTGQGKLANRDPTILKRLTHENEQLHFRINLLEAALLALCQDALVPKNAEDDAARLEILRQATLDYCRKKNVDPEIWKNLES